MRSIPGADCSETTFRRRHSIPTSTRWETTALARLHKNVILRHRLSAHRPRHRARRRHSAARTTRSCAGTPQIATMHRGPIARLAPRRRADRRRRGARPIAHKILPALVVRPGRTWPWNFPRAAAGCERRRRALSVPRMIVQDHRRAWCPCANLVPVSCACGVLSCRCPAQCVCPPVMLSHRVHSVTRFNDGEDELRRLRAVLLYARTGPARCWACRMREAASFDSFRIL